MDSKYISIQGHRGFRGLYPENTLIAFIEAVKCGADTLEMDVVISGDNKVVVSHEAWMNDVFCTRPDGAEVEKGSAQKYNLYKMNYAEIASYDCGKRGNPDFPNQKKIAAHKPLLNEVIADVDEFATRNNFPPVKYNIEIKSEPGEDGIFNPVPETFVRLVYNEIKEKNIFDRLILQSFDVRILQQIKKVDSSITISLLVENTLGLKKNLELLGFNPEIYGPEYILIDDEMIRELKIRNIKLIPWTINEIADVKRLVEMGVDGIITDFPDRTVKLLRGER